MLVHVTLSMHFPPTSKSSKLLPSNQLTSHSITKIHTCSAARAILQRVSIPQLQTGFIDANVERKNVTESGPGMQEPWRFQGKLANWTVVCFVWYMPTSAMCKYLSHLSLIPCASSYIGHRSCHKSPWSCKAFAPRLGATCKKNDVEKLWQNQHALTIAVCFDSKFIKRDSSFSSSHLNPAPLWNDSLHMSFWWYGGLLLIYAVYT